MKNIIPLKSLRAGGEDTSESETLLILSTELFMGKTVNST